MNWGNIVERAGSGFVRFGGRAVLAWMLAGCGSSVAGLENAEEGSTPPSGQTGDVGDPGGAGDAADGQESAPNTGDVEEAVVDPGSLGAAESSPGAELELPPLGAPYPLVLIHGFFGFDEFAGLEFATYFYKVKEILAADGELLVYTPAVDPYNNSTVRGQALIEHIEEILAATGHEKVDLVGHSQGGLDARVVASLRPDLVGAVVTLATPHFGTAVADAMLGLVPGVSAQAALDWFVNQLAKPFYKAAGNDSSLMETLRLLSTRGSQAFNKQYPDAADVAYYSITGRSDWHGGGDECEADREVAFVSDFQDQRDPVDLMLAFSEAILDGGLFENYPNDGMVRAAMARWGTFLGCIPADHYDELGHMLGDRPGLFNAWNYQNFWVELVRFLRAEGY